MHHHAVGGPVAGELVGDKHPRHLPQSLEQSAEHFYLHAVSKASGGVGMKVAVTGAAEFLGTNLINQLVDRGPDV